MGYNYYVSRIVLGICDSAIDGQTIDPYWLETKYSGVLRCYAGEINKHTNIYPIIGIECAIDVDNGKIVYDEDDYNVLKQFVDDYIKYHGDTSPSISYNAAISGDYEYYGSHYTLDE